MSSRSQQKQIPFPDIECRPNNLLEAYFKHRAAHNSINNNDHLLKTSGRNLIDPDYDIVDAREPGSFVKLRDSKAWSGLSQVVSPHRDEIRASSMIQVRKQEMESLQLVISIQKI